jgi:hypothetical protein
LGVMQNCWYGDAQFDDGRPDLSLVIYNPATPEDVNKIRGLLKSEAKPNRGGVATHERESRKSKRSLLGTLPELLCGSRKRVERCGNAENFRFRFRS